MIINAFSIPPTCNFRLSVPLTTLPITHTGHMLVSTYSGNNVSGRTLLSDLCVWKGETSLLFREYRLLSCTQKPSISSTEYWLWPQIPLSYVTYIHVRAYVHVYTFFFFSLTILVNEPNIGFLSDEKRRIGGKDAPMWGHGMYTNLHLCPLPSSSEKEE